MHTHLLLHAPLLRERLFCTCATSTRAPLVFHMRTLFICEPFLYANPFHLRRPFICDALSSANPFHMRTLFICDALSSANPFHMRTLFICDALSSANPFHMRTLFICDALPSASLLHLRRSSICVAPPSASLLHLRRSSICVALSSVTALTCDYFLPAPALCLSTGTAFMYRPASPATRNYCRMESIFNCAYYHLKAVSACALRSYVIFCFCDARHLEEDFI